MIIILLVIALIIIGVWLFMRGAQFGSMPSGDRLVRIEHSPNYRNGQFQNLSNTPSFTDGATFFSVTRDFLFRNSKRGKPSAPLPSKKIDLHSLSPEENILVWFGHSSYFLQVDGKRILVDPVFSGHASPLSFTTKSFAGADVYTVDDIPPIDYLFISHDHWDHLDYPTVSKLRPKVKKVITGLGVGAHLERWGYEPGNILERDWNEEAILDDGFVVHTAPARHFSGRGFKRNTSLWLSFVLITPTMRLYLGGDSGYDTHFADIGSKYGPFDLVILENGQYNKSWKYIHMMPEEVVQAAQDLRAKNLLAVHWGKFTLSLHDWDEPIKRVTAAAKGKVMPLLTPMIGEAMPLKNDTYHGTDWWVRL